MWQERVSRNASFKERRGRERRKGRREAVFFEVWRVCGEMGVLTRERAALKKMRKAGRQLGGGERTRGVCVCVCVCVCMGKRERERERELEREITRTFDICTRAYQSGNVLNTATSCLNTCAFFPSSLALPHPPLPLFLLSLSLPPSSPLPPSLLPPLSPSLPPTRVCCRLGLVGRQKMAEAWPVSANHV